MSQAPFRIKKPVALFWFRRDLRLSDNVALAAALNSGLPVVPFFLFDSEILSKLEDRDDKRVEFIHRTLTELKAELRDLGSDLLVLHGSPEEIWEELFATVEIKQIYFNHDYEPQAEVRDGKIRELAQARGLPLHTFKDQVIFDKDDVQKGGGGPYTVFTPYSKKWLSQLTDKDLKAHQGDTENFLKFRAPPMPSLDALGFESSDFVFPSAKTEKKKIATYLETRDTPSIPGTTRLGLHLRFGTVSVRELVKLARSVEETTWLKELIWREFFMQILWHFPHVVKGPFRPAYEKIQWRRDKADFSAWCEGRTGYPIVDAGLRELRATGFMHNRVRMVAASFLVKHLLIDPKWGEEFFARYLLDFELSSNNGNWQWVAGTGCDAAPYFRVFNPDTQTKKFDKQNKYIKQWVPEFGTHKYPEPIVSHTQARVRALRAYALGLGKKAPDPSRAKS